MTRPKAVAIGAGALGLGFLAERLAPDYDICLVDVSDRMGLLEAVVRNQGFTVNVCGPTDVRVKSVRGVFDAVCAEEEVNLRRVLRESDLIFTATGRRVLDSLVPRIATALEANDIIQWVLFCENGLNIAETFAGSFGPQVTTVDTVMSRMCRFAGPEERRYAPVWPGYNIALVVEDYDLLPLDESKCDGGPFSRAFSLISGEGFSCWEDMKLYMHNGAHAFLAYHAFLQGTRLFKDIGPELRARANLMMLNEIIPAISRTHPTVDPDMIQRNGLDLLRRFVSPTFDDTIARGVRGAAEKLQPGERLLGGSDYIRRVGIDPVEYGSTIEAARQVVEACA